LPSTLFHRADLIFAPVPRPFNSLHRARTDFDSLAGAAAYKYVLPDNVPVDQSSAYEFFLVTAAVDRMDMLRPLLNPDGSIPDLRISGHVSYATESSLEVFVRLSTLPPPTAAAGEEGETILVGRFAMACRSFKGGKHKIAKLLVEGPEEEEMWKMGKEMREGKRARGAKSLQKTPPTAVEAALLHSMFVERADVFGAFFSLPCLTATRLTASFTHPPSGYLYAFTHPPFGYLYAVTTDRTTPTPENIIFMTDTQIKTASLMHPQERNVHGKIFGGHLMRLAYEAAFSTSCLFARAPVTFVALDELLFASPVDVGSLLVLDSKITYSPIEIEGEHRSFSCSVEAATIDLHSGAKQVTKCVLSPSFPPPSSLSFYSPPSLVYLPRTYS
jgi:acyl-coenzyme A thioesterase 9